MKKANNHSHIMLRYLMITAAIFIFGALIAIKLFKTTILDADKWNAKANSELQSTGIIYPQRGDILAADGTVLVTNLCFYNIRIDYRCEGFMAAEYLRCVDALSDSLALYFPQHDRTGWRDILIDQYNREPGARSRSFKLLGGISYAELEKFRTFPFFGEHRSNRTGMVTESYMKRDYPYGSMARRSIGRVGQTLDNPEIHGISGLEKSIDSLLYGTPGVYKRVPFTKHIGNWTDIPAVNGYNVKTTIDIALQDILEEELNTILDSCSADWGTAVLMEVATGDIKAISNLEYDPSSGRYIEAFNRAVVAYEPGSVVKPISMMFALERGLVDDLNEVIPIGASFAYGGGSPITDSHYNSALTVAGVIEQSSNIGMTRITIRGFNDNPKEFVKCFEDIGFFEPMNSGIAEEERPRMRRDPKRIDMSRMCYGYATAIPPLYTMSVYNAIANDGKYVRPRLVSALNRDGVDSIIPVSYIRDSICSHRTAMKMREMLSLVVDGEHGTGRRLRNPYVSIAGKTGTCYDINPETHQYDRSRKRLAFCGFFPVEDPKYTCMVLTYHPRRNLMGAASTSGEVLKNVALKMYSRGLLGNSSDYRETPNENPGRPVINATTEANSNSKLASAIGDESRPRRLSHPEGAGADNVPNVKHLGLREALTRLEQAGFEVKFSGVGHVVAQKLADDRRTVHLTLANK